MVANMDVFERSALIGTLVQELRHNGSWCGETHVQKGTFLLQELERVSLEYDFILYKHGPFSFALSDELGVMRGYGLLALEPSREGFRPRIAETEGALRNFARHEQLIGAQRSKIEAIARGSSARRVRPNSSVSQPRYSSPEDNSLVQRPRHVRRDCTNSSVTCPSKRPWKRSGPSTRSAALSTCSARTDQAAQPRRSGVRQRGLSPDLMMV
jgi:uncharacterized protein YwgA